jgi:hypothetical protein
VHVAVTDHPTAEWTVQQFREAFPWDQAPRYLLGAKSQSHRPDVLVKQSTETIATLDANLVLLVRGRDRGACRMRWPEAQRSVRPMTIVVCDEDCQDLLEMLFAQNQRQSRHSERTVRTKRSACDPQLFRPARVPDL